MTVRHRAGGQRRDRHLLTLCLCSRWCSASEAPWEGSGRAAVADKPGAGGEETTGPLTRGTVPTALMTGLTASQPQCGDPGTVLCSYILQGAHLGPSFPRSDASLSGE